MSAAVAESGVQSPRFSHIPDGVVDNRSSEAIELIAAAGMPMDEWQVSALSVMLGERADGTWAAQEMGLMVARQSGKNSVLEARELAGLFLFGEHRIVHSAHQSATADEAFKRMRNLIEGVPWLDAEVAKILGSPGRQSIRLKSGAELSYRTRTRGGARGFSAPIVVFDEAQELTGEQLAAIVPVTSSFRNRQIIYTGTVLAGAAVFRGVVERGRQGLGSALGYAEWSAPEGCRSDDESAILQANPGIGNRPGLTVEYCLNELGMFRAAGAEDKWREERLSIWPDEAVIGQLIPSAAWAACQVGWRPPADQVVDHIGVASTVDGSYSSVGVAFQRGGAAFVQVVKHEPGTAWVIPYVKGLVERRRPRMVVLDQGGPASKSLSNGLEAVLPRGVLRETKTSEAQAAQAQFVDAVLQGRIQHTGQPVLDAAATGVREKLVGDARMFDRRKSPVVIAPVEAVTLAAWGLIAGAPRPSKYESGDLLVLGG